jgi:hypothetical protein
MKKFIVGLLFGTIITSAVAYNREGLYHLFGAKMMEAVILVIKDEINILRVKAGLPERTDEQVRQAITTKIDNMPKYNHPKLWEGQ